MNPRAARSRKKLGDAIVSLLLEQGFESSPSITAVRKRAEVAHMTFYRHYSSVEELLTDALRTTILDLAQLLREQETIYDLTVALFKYVQEHQDRFRVYVGLPDTHPVREMLKEESVKIVVEHWEAKGASTVPMDVLVNHMVESTCTFLRWYLDHINDHTPEEVADFYDELIVKSAESRTLSLRTDKHLHAPGEHED